MTTVNLLSKYLLVMELRFDAMLYSNMGNENSDYMGNENSDAGHIKCSRGPQVPTPALKHNELTRKQLC